MRSDRELSASARPGQMTTAMRALAASSARQGPKLLRVGLVQHGRLREERTLTTARDVSVGTSEENSFLLAGATAPTNFRLFEVIGDSYQLNFTDEMSGRVALSDGLFELGDLKARAQGRGRGTYRIALSDTARGKVVLGDVSILFHFVERSPVVPKAVLPAAVLRGPARVDWNSTFAAAVSFLAHFLILGAVYSDWGDPVIDDDLRTAGLIDSLRNLPPPPPVEDKSPPEEAPTRARDATPTSQTKPSQTKTSEVPRAKDGPSTGQPDFRSQTDHARLSRELEQIDTSIVGALLKSGPATDAVLRGSEVAWAALDVAAASRAGVGNGSGPTLAPGRTRVVPGTFDPREWGVKTRSSDGPGRVAHVQGPSGIANIAPASTLGGAVSDAARVVAGMRAAFRACYQRGLAENPDASGGIRLTLRVGSGGEVSSVTATPSGNLPLTVVSCVQARARAAQFNPPEGGAAVITVPVTFVKQ